MNTLAQVVSFIALAVIILSGTAVYNRINNAKKLREKLASGWGKPPENKYRDSEFLSVSDFYTNRKECKSGVHLIDDITWHDLDMDKVFMRLNNTQSSVGEEVLYSILREPLLDSAELEKRNKLIAFFQENPEARLKLQFILARLGKVYSLNISSYFLTEKKATSRRTLLYRFLAGLALVSPLLLIADIGAGIAAIITTFAINMTIYYKAKNEIGAHLEALSYIVNLAGSAQKIISSGIDGISDYTADLSASYKKIKGISKRSFYLFYTNTDPFLEYAKIIFLKELIDYEVIKHTIDRHKAELLNVFMTVGLLDSMLAIASYRDSTEFYTVPVLSRAGENSPRQLSFEDIYHPLISKPVTNSISLKGSALITGSNASGKSTFLKTVAINAILAQTVNTCLARSYRSDYYMIFSSMALKDDLMKNESYYITEIKSLKRIVDSLNSEVPCLCFIDEVLRGTNTIERIAASSQVLYHLGRHNCLCIAATHDIELAYILKAYFENYHFQEKFEDNQIIFDYRIYPGKSNTRNAVRLLRIMGYPDDIVNAAEDRAASFIRNGSWNRIGE